MKVLVLGGAGMLGHQVFLKLKDALGPESVACTLRKPKDHYQDYGIFSTGHIFDEIDVLNFQGLQRTLDTFRPDYVVNCVGITLRKPELEDMKKCIEINAMLPHRLSKWGQRNHCRIIHFSTDCVFDGKKGQYTELDIPTADDLYGESKFLGEVQYDNALTLRLSIIGRELEAKTELVEWFLKQRGKTVNGYVRALYSGVTTNFVAAEVTRILENLPTLHGLFQVASEPISKYNLLKCLNRIYDANVEILPYEDYVSDKTLNCDLYSKATGFRKPSWEEMIVNMKNEERVNYE